MTSHLVVTSQNTNKIRVTNESGDPLSYAHITFGPDKNGDSFLLLTDEQGQVVVPSSFHEGDIIPVKVAYVGFQSRNDTIKPGDPFEFQLQPEDVSLNQVVITGQYAPNSPDKSVHKVKIIDRKEMDARGVNFLSDALQFETNMRISQDNVLGSSISVQGLSGENVKIMIDGVPIVGRQDGNIDLNQINMNNIERVEIIEGPLSVKYGSNALAGTINLITKKEARNTYETNFNTYYESVGQYNIDGEIGYNKGNHHIKVSGGRNFFDGWSPGEPYSLVPQSNPADSSRNLAWNPKEQIFGNASYQFTQKKNTYRIFGDLFEETITNRGTPRAPYYETAFDEYYLTRRSSVGVDLNGKLSEEYRWSVLAAYNTYTRSKLTYFKDLTTLDEILSENPTDHDTTAFNTWMSRGSISYVSKGRLSGELGYDINHETAFGKRIESKEQSIGDYALFTTVQWIPIENLTIKPGLRYAYNTRYTAPLIPSLNLRYVRGIATMRASYAMGFRAPSLKELYFEFVDVNHNIYGNPELKAETSHNVQGDVNLKWRKGQNLTSIDAGVFYNDLSNMITLGQVGDATRFSYVNVGKYQTYGLDLGASYAFNHWKTSAGFVYTARVNYFEVQDFTQQTAYSPELRATVMYEFKEIGGNLSAFYKYNGALPIYTVDEIGQISQRFMDPYNMLDIAATKYFLAKKLQWSVGFKNLFDVQDINAAQGGGVHSGGGGTVPVAWGRTVFTSLKLNLGWK